VRQRVAALAADLPGGGLAILRTLLDDPNASIRALAAALLARRLPAPLSAARPAPGPSPPAKGPSGPGAAADAPLGQASPAPPDEATAPTGDSGEAQAAQLTQSGVKLLQRHEFARAQKLFEKARHLCGHEKKSGPCEELLLKMSYHLGRAYEAQGYEAEAMAEFERYLLKSRQPRLAGVSKAEELEEAQSAIVRLAPRLGVVKISRSSGKQCVEVTRWMPPGVHTIEVDGQKHEVNIRPDAPARVGSCP
jgi:hypothetical protein